MMERSLERSKTRTKEKVLPQLCHLHKRWSILIKTALRKRDYQTVIIPQYVLQFNKKVSQLIWSRHNARGIPLSCNNFLFYLCEAFSKIVFRGPIGLIERVSHGLCEEIVWRLDWDWRETDWIALFYCNHFCFKPYQFYSVGFQSVYHTLSAYSVSVFYWNNQTNSLIDRF